MKNVVEYHKLQVFLIMWIISFLLQKVGNITHPIFRF